MTAEEIQKFRETLLSYYKGLSLDRVSIGKSIDEILGLESNDLRRLSPESCGEYAFELSKYSLYLQQELNKHEALIKKCDEYLKYIIAPRMVEITAYSFDERKMIAIRDNSVAVMLFNAIRDAQAHIAALSYLPARVESMTKSLLALQETKRWQK